MTTARIFPALNLTSAAPSLWNQVPRAKACGHVLIDKRKRQSELAVAVPTIVQDIMSRQVIALLESATLKQAIELFTSRGISGAPVLNAHRRLIGVITMTDLLRHVFNEEAVNLLVSASGELMLQKSLCLLEMPVGDYMTRSVITVTPDTPISEACDLLMHHQIRRLIVSEEGNVKGVFSLWDAVPHLRWPQRERIC